MYLEARRFIWQSWSGEATTDIQINAGIQQLIPGIGSLRVSGVTVQAMYWRKANAIHRWFVDECQDGTDDCRPHRVGRDQLIQLRDICQAVLDDPNRASELLPTQGGFFFGSTEYGEGYMQDCRETVDGLTSIIDNAEFEKNWDFYYHASW